MKVALLTGCSTGIGRALCGLLAERGWAVVATARDPGSLSALPAALRLPLDVTDRASIEAAVAVVVARFGRIDALVNNAGYAMRAAVEEIPEGEMRKMFDVNLFGLVAVTQAVLPVMREGGGGRIVNLSSISGRFSQPANGAYCASKHAVEALSDALRNEVHPFNIQVCLVEPGPIKTAFEARASGGSAAILENPGSPYAGLYAAHRTMKERQEEADPRLVARVILDALEAERPRPRYMAAVPAASALASRLPDGARDRLLRRLFGLGSA
jgi:NAD(P)-dependent dehydrogenase (short-subunit alcohol dehydrogenase family)